jgi:hypothetical protein
MLAAFPFALYWWFKSHGGFERFPKGLTRRARRGLVIAVAATIGAIAVAWTRPEGNPLHYAAEFWALGLFFVVNAGLKRWTYAQVPESELDERQRHQLMLAYRSAYSVAIACPTLIYFAILGCHVLHQSPGQAETQPILLTISEPGASALVFFSVFFFALVIPGLILAWQEPDAPQEERRDEPREA